MATRRSSDSSRTTKSTSPVAAGEGVGSAADTAASAPKRAPRRRATAAPKEPTPVEAVRIEVPEEARRAMIAEAAYLRAERRGFAPGFEVEDWLAAEAEVDALLAAGSGSAPQ
jgi:hypothetical protein